MSITDTNPKIQIDKKLHFQDIRHLFAQLDSQSVEQFYQGYHFWAQQQRIKQLTAQIAILQQQVSENAEQMQQMQPSTLALVTLAQLQASGVDDLDLLERMLDRGEEWLDHTMQLLVLCQQLDVIQGDYTQWCEHALEGAYEWIASMFEASASVEQSLVLPIDATEELLLQKLMSNDDNPPVSQTVTPAPTLFEDTISMPEEILSPESDVATEHPEMASDFFPEATETMLFQKLMSESSAEADNQLSSDAENGRSAYSASTWYNTYNEANLLADVTEEMLFQKLMSDPDVTAPELHPERRRASSTWSEQDTTIDAIDISATSDFFDQGQDIYIPDNIEILDLSIATSRSTEAPPASDKIPALEEQLPVSKSTQSSAQENAEERKARGIEE